jgi:hypothetical protein
MEPKKKLRCGEAEALKAKLKPRRLIDMVQCTSEFSPTASLQASRRIGADRATRAISALDDPQRSEAQTEKLPYSTAFIAVFIFWKLKAPENELDRIKPDWSDLDSDSNLMLYRNHAFKLNNHLQQSLFGYTMGD